MSVENATTAQRRSITPRHWDRAIGGAIYGIVYLAFAWLPGSQSWYMWPPMATYGVYIALTDGVGKALIADNSPRHVRGAAMGVFYALTGLTTLIASLMTGIIWDRYGATPALTISSFLDAIALVSLSTHLTEPREKRQNSHG